jgi:type II secretory pathway pseudopilin PulG
MSSDTGSVSNVTTTSSPMPTTETTVEVAVVETQVQDMQGQIDTAMSEVSTPSEADQVANQIVAQNLQAQQQEAQASQETTGEYSDQSVFVAYLGYNAGFTNYYGRDIPKQNNWYEPKDIYADVTMNDNINAFYQLAGNSLNTLNEMKRLQPELRDGVL